MDQINIEMAENDELLYENIIEMRRQRLSWSDIARDLNWPLHKLSYFRYKHDIQDVFVTIDDEEVWRYIQLFQNQNLRWGDGMLLGALKSVTLDDESKLYVPRSQLRRVLHNYDSIGVNIRKTKAVFRVKYSNQGLNYSWHLDGWHKLIDYKIVVHGCIDGFSRKIIFLKASTNNKATTVFSIFFNKVRELSEIPSLISVDGGGENVLVADYMIYQLGSDALKIVSSVHNQRIERLWRDSTEKAMIDYMNLFADLRNEEILNIEVDEQLWLIHFLFLDLINQSLERFLQSWNNHSLRTENFHLSPNQIEFFAKRDNNMFVPPDNINILDTGTLLDDYDNFDDNNNIPLVNVSRIQNPFNDHNDFIQFVEQVNLITTEDMRTGNIEIVKDKWIAAFVLMMQIINNNDINDND